MIETKKARNVVKFFRSQRQQIGNVRLLGIKVLLSDKTDADNVCTYITKNYFQYDAHVKSEYEPIMSIWYKNLVPCVNVESTEKLAEELVELFNNQKRTAGDMKLLSIKAMLPKGAVPDEISKYIVEKYPKYKVHSKQQSQYPIVAIGYK